MQPLIARTAPAVPDGLPVLGRGRHRSPADGACVMEYASLLAGERWSDDPRCTLPALSALARAVNDCSSDAARQALLVLVPDVVHALGLDGEQARLGQRLARRACLVALPHAGGLRRRTLLVALLAAELACGPGPVASDDPDREAVRDLLRDPDEALLSAVRLTRKAPPQLRYDRDGVAASLQIAVVTIAEASGPDADGVLHTLLTDAVAIVRGVPTRQPVLAAAAPLPEPAGYDVRAGAALLPELSYAVL